MYLKEITPAVLQSRQGKHLNNNTYWGKCDCNDVMTHCHRLTHKLE